MEIFTNTSDYGLTEGSSLRENEVSIVNFLIMSWMVVHHVPNGKAISGPMAQGVQAQMALRKPA